MKSPTMRRAGAICLVLAGASGASAQTSENPFTSEIRGQSVACADFRHEADGAWTTLKPVPIQRENEYTMLASDVTLRAGDRKIVGIDVAAMLDAVCPH